MGLCSESINRNLSYQPNVMCSCRGLDTELVLESSRFGFQLFQLHVMTLGKLFTYIYTITN